MTLSKEYRSQEWREDLRRAVTRAGRDGVPLVFVVTDTVLRDQDWLLEDAQRLLDFAEVPGLLAADEMEGILAKLRALAPESGRDPDSSMRIWFLERCVLNLRFAFIVSPLGNALRGKLRACPALAQCTTIDWFDEWPVEALQAVARSELKSLSMSSAAIMRSDHGIDEASLDLVVDACVHAHVTSKSLARRYDVEQRRTVHLTPTHYLELLTLLQSLLFAKRKEIMAKKDRFDIGLRRLLKSAESVVDLQQELEELKPKLIVASVQADEMLSVVQVDRDAAAEKRLIVEAEEQVSKESVAEATILQAECETELARAMPALELAVKAVKELSKNDVAEVKALKNPPAGVRLTMETVCLIKGVKPLERKLPGKPATYDFWEPARKMISDTFFLQSLLEFDRDSITHEAASAVRSYLSNPDFEPERVAKASIAACGLCKWVRAMMIYYDVNLEVEPRRKRLAAAKASAEQAKRKLDATTAELKAVMAKLEVIEAEYNKVVGEKDAMESKINDTANRLKRANQLIGGLGGERTRWATKSKSSPRRTPTCWVTSLSARRLSPTLGHSATRTEWPLLLTGCAPSRR